MTARVRIGLYMRRSPLIAQWLLLIVSFDPFERFLDFVSYAHYPAFGVSKATTYIRLVSLRGVGVGSHIVDTQLCGEAATQSCHS